jgi:hypothetical protein
MKKIVSPAFQIGSLVWGSWYVGHHPEQNIVANFVFVSLVILFVGVFLHKKDLL